MLLRAATGREKHPKLDIRPATARGEGLDFVREVKPAAEIIEDLVAGGVAALERSMRLVC